MYANRYANMLHTSTLWSSQEIKLDSDNNLSVTQLSFRHKRSNTIPLDLIEANPKVSQKPDTQLLGFSLACMLATVVFTVTALNINPSASLALVLPVIFAGFSLAALIFAFKQHTRSYHFYFANTSTRIFKLEESSQNRQIIRAFVRQLSEKIAQLKQKQPISIDGDAEFTQHLDFLYNHGVVNDVVYERINQRINEKVNGYEPEVHLAEVIPLPIKKA